MDLITNEAPVVTESIHPRNQQRRYICDRPTRSEAIQALSRYGRSEISSLCLTHIITEA